MSRGGGSRGRGMRAFPSAGTTMAPPASTTTSSTTTATATAEPKRLSMAKIFGTNSIETPEQRAEFLAWCKSMDIFVHPEVHLGVDIKGMGRGVVAGAKLKKGTSILLVPQRALLSPHDPLTGSEAHRNSPVVPILHENMRRTQMPKVSDFTRVVVRLMSEVSRRRHSPWLPWITMCPVMGSAIWELPSECVAGTDVGHTLEDKDVLGQWELIKPIIEANPTAFVPPLNTFQLYLQCVSQVASRNFHIEYHEADADMPSGPFLKLVPVVDFLNHSPDINAVLKMHGGRGRAPLQLELLCCRDVEAGEQLLFSYSDMSSGRFLTEFQFVPRYIPNGDAVRISQKQLIEFCSQVGGLKPEDVTERVKYLDNDNYIYREGIFIPSQELSAQQQQREAELLAKQKEEESVTTKEDDEFEKVRKRAGNLSKREKEEIEVWNTIAILTMPKNEYDKFVGTLQKWWRCDRAAEKVKKAINSVLGLRLNLAASCEKACRGRVDEAKKKDEETKAGVDSQVAPTLISLIEQYQREQKIISGFLEKTVPKENQQQQQKAVAVATTTEVKKE